MAVARPRTFAPVPFWLPGDKGSNPRPQYSPTPAAFPDEMAQFGILMNTGFRQAERIEVHVATAVSSTGRALDTKARSCQLVASACRKLARLSNCQQSKQKSRVATRMPELFDFRAYDRAILSIAPSAAKLRLLREDRQNSHYGLA